MIELNFNFLDKNKKKVLDDFDGNEILELAYEQPLLCNFVIPYLHEKKLNNLLRACPEFDSADKPESENGDDSSADSICIKGDKEFRMQLKNMDTSKLKESYKIKEGNTTLLVDHRLTKGIGIKCTPNHTRPFYSRSELDVMVADLWPLTGKATFLYKLIDDIEPPTEKQKLAAINDPEKVFCHSDDVREYVAPSQNIKWNNKIGRFCDGWTENIDEITSKLFNDNHY